MIIATSSREAWLQTYGHCFCCCRSKRGDSSRGVTNGGYGGGGGHETPRKVYTLRATLAPLWPPKGGVPVSMQNLFNVYNAGFATVTKSTRI